MRLRRCAASAARRSKASSRRAASARSPTSPISPAASIRAPSTSACWRASSPPALSMPSSRTARAYSPPSTLFLPPRSARTRMPRSASRSCFGGRRRPSRSLCRRSSRGCRRERLQREYDAVGFFLSGHPLDDYAAALKRLRVQSWSEFARAVKAAPAPAASPAPWWRAPSGAPRTAPKWASSVCPIRAAITKRCCSRRAWRNIAICSSPGTAVLLFLTAEVQGDEVRARIQSVEPLDQAAAKMQKGLRVFLRDDAPIEGVAKRLEPMQAAAARNGADHADGEVSHGADVRKRQRSRGQAARAASRSRRRSPAPSRR